MSTLYNDPFEMLHEPLYVENALAMAARNIPVGFLPKGQKKNIEVGWEDKATIARDEIVKKAQQNPNWQNICLVAKAVPSGRLFWDIDDPAIVLEYENFYGKLAQTLKNQTFSGGYHYIFEHTEESLAFQKEVSKAYISESGINGELWSLRMHNAYIVGPGSSVTKDGITGYYKIVEDAPIATMPDTLLTFLKDRYLKSESGKKNTNATDDGQPISEGGRNSQLTSIGGKLRGAGSNQEEIEAVLLRINQERCQPPLTETEVQTIARSVARYEVRNDSLVLRGGVPAGSQPDVISPKSSVEPDPRTEVTPLVSVDGDKFMVEIIPPRRVLLQTVTKHEPVFFEQSINQIFAWRGTGKTNVGLGLTMAFATAGSFLNWEAPHRSRVLYVEGEMPESQLQERWNFIVGKTNGYARLITVDKQPLRLLPSLATQRGMDKVEVTLAALAAEGFKVDVLMLDSISTLFNVKANDEETWITIQAWLMNLRSRGYCIFFFHHSGKGGLSRSHSKSEDMLDVSIKLESPKEKEGGCLHAIMTYDKVRAGLDEPSAEIKMRRAHSDVCLCRKAKGMAIGCRGDSVVWEYRETTDALLAKAFQMFDDSASLSEVAKELKVARSTAQYWKNKWEEKGKSEPDAIL